MAGLDRGGPQRPVSVTLEMLMRATILSLSVLALIACGSDHPVDRSIDVNEAIADDLCTCPAIAGEDFCTMPEPINSAEVACLKRTYNQYEAELEATVDCFYDADRELYNCIRAADCAEVSLQSCFDVAEARYDGCPLTTEAAANALEACSPDDV